MTADTAIDMFSSALMQATWISFLLIFPGLLVGLLVSTMQAVTQINEQTLSFLPRLMVTLICLMFGLRWILQTLSDTFTEYFTLISMVAN